MLCLKRVTRLHLLIAYCSNKHLHIFGFYPQIREEDKIIDEEAMKVTIVGACQNCGCQVTKSIDLMWDPNSFSDGAGI